MEAVKCPEVMLLSLMEAKKSYVTKDWEVDKPILASRHQLVDGRSTASRGRDDD